jgi:aryl-alcohol dehydrogenase-like predicted oxidoreductase
MRHINLGTFKVSRIGLGTMGMSTASTGAGVPTGKGEGKSDR